MRRLLGKALASATLAASAAGVFAAPTQAAPVAVKPAYFSYGCDYGRACLRLQAPVANDIWNLEACGYNSMHDYYNWAMARGNAFTTYYQNGTWDYTAAWTQRSLDQRNLVTSVYVYC